MLRVLRRIVMGIASDLIKKIRIPHALIQKLAVLYVIAWSISPPLQVDTKYRLIALACVGIYFFFILSEHRKFQKIHIWAALFAIAVLLIAYIQFGGMSGALKPMAVYMLVICYIINYCYQGRWDELLGVVPIVLILLAIWNLKTVQVLLDDPTIARLLVRNDAETYTYLRKGVGGYGLIYPQVCIFPAILAWIIKTFRYNFMYFLVGSIWLLSYILFLMEAGYSIAIFASAAGALILLAYKGKNAVGVFLIAAGVFVGTLLLIIHVDPLRNLLLDIFEGTAVTKKINDLVDTSTSGAAEGSFQVRIVRYMASINTMFQYPIIGSLWYSSGGGHSAILDAFAKYGLWGGWMYSKMVFFVQKDYKRRINHPVIYSISNGTLVTLLFVSILDSFSYSFMCMILLVLPLLYEDIIKWEKIQV